MAVKKNKQKEKPKDKKKIREEKIAKYKEKRRKQKRDVSTTLLATSAVIEAARALAEQEYSRIMDKHQDFSLLPGDEKLRDLFIALDAYDMDEAYTPFLPPEIVWPLRTANEMAGDLGISPERLRDWLREETDFEKIGGTWQFTKEMQIAARERFPQQDQEAA